MRLYNYFKDDIIFHSTVMFYAPEASFIYSDCLGMKLFVNLVR